MPHLFNSGDAAFASRLSFPWQTYAVAWQGVTNPTFLGNGTLLGKWTRVGDIAFYSIDLTWGTTTSAAGAGRFQFTLPTNAMTPIVRFNNYLYTHGAGQAHGYDAGIAEYEGMAALNGPVGGVNLVSLYQNGMTTAFGWDATHPFTWGSGDIIRVGGWFPVQP